MVGVVLMRKRRMLTGCGCFVVEDEWRGKMLIREKGGLQTEHVRVQKAANALGSGPATETNDIPV